jgi:hypothetical protein
MNDMRYIDGLPNYFIYEEKLKETPIELIHLVKYNDSISFEEDVQFYNFMNELRNIIKFIETDYKYKKITND